MVKVRSGSKTTVIESPFFSLPQALYNVSTTSTRSADEVLEELKQTIQRRNILYKQKG